MSAEFWAGTNPINTALLIGVIVFLWRLSGELRRDIADIRERLAKLEGQVELLLRGLHIEIQSGQPPVS